jgi:hydroxymethylglutaryl-CoA reductase (NADPH)
MSAAEQFAPVPLRWVGPLRISGNVMTGETEVPLATYESPLWPSVRRGARISTMVEGGILATLVDERMSRSVLFEADDAGVALAAIQYLTAHRADLEQVVQTSSRFARLIDVHHQIAGNLLFVRFELTTGDASGHNMVTHASERLMDHVLGQVPGLRYGSISGNFCSDKKATAVNGILGRRTRTTRTCCWASSWRPGRTPRTSWRARRGSRTRRCAARTCTSPARCRT